jgi:Zn finger protein HypA/HybF involved in hydrogenase expression
MKTVGELLVEAGYTSVDDDENVREALRELLEIRAAMDNEIAPAATLESGCAHCGGEMYQPEDSDAPECAWCDGKQPAATTGGEET